MRLDWLLGAVFGPAARTMGRGVAFLVVSMAVGLAAGCGDDGAGDDDDDDVTVDAGPEGDAGPDFRFICTIGDACGSVDDCPGGNPVSRTCVEPVSEEIGLPIDPVVGLEGSTYTTTEWVEGYCSNRGTEAQGGCTEDEDCGITRMGEPNCGRCLTVDFDPNGEPIRSCFLACTPSNEDNGGCRPGYLCDFGLAICVPGCSNDEECRVYREDTNDNGVIDRYNPIVNPGGDRLVYDTTSDASCDAETWFCRQSGNPNATAGDPCDRNGVCMEDGECLTEIGTRGEFPGGYCTRIGCDIPGRQCDDETEICQARGFGDTAACLRRCTVGAEADTEVPPEMPPGGNCFENDCIEAFGLERGTPSCNLLTGMCEFDVVRGAGGRGAGCRTGYACTWDGELSPSNDQGGCLPGNYNDIDESNVGDFCGVRAGAGPRGLDDGSCYSPFGAGECTGITLRLDQDVDPENLDRYWWTTCAIRDCRAAGISEECTSVGGTCVEFADQPPSNSLCLKPCDTQADCGGGLACNRGITGDGSGVCWWSCRDRDGARQNDYCQPGWECRRNGGFCFPQ